MYKQRCARAVRVILKGFDHEYAVSQGQGQHALPLHQRRGAQLPSAPAGCPLYAFACRKILPEDPNMLLQSVHFVGDYIFAIYMKDASSRVSIYTRRRHGA